MFEEIVNNVNLQEGRGNPFLSGRKSETFRSSLRSLRKVLLWSLRLGMTFDNYMPSLVNFVAKTVAPRELQFGILLDR